MSTLMDALLTKASAMDWLERAACKDSEIGDFFPDAGHDGIRQADAARVVCWSCPVRAECLAWATSGSENPRRAHGVFAGLTVDERRDGSSEMKEPPPPPPKPPGAWERKRLAKAAAERAARVGLMEAYSSVEQGEFPGF